MHSFDDKGLQAIVAKMAEMQNQINELNKRPSAIPVRSEDPPVDEPINIWMFPDGRIRYRLPNAATVQQITVSATGSTSSAIPLPAPEYFPSTQVYEQDADWSQAYAQGGTVQRTGTELHYGSLDNITRQNMSLIHFPGLAAALTPGAAGIRIAAVELILTNLATYLPSGTSLAIGTHTHATKPSTFSHSNWPLGSLSVGNPSIMNSYSLDPETVGDRLLAGATGFSLFQDSIDRAFYGVADGVGGSVSPPRLRVVYVK